MNCYLCFKSDLKIRHKGVRDNKLINVIECSNCGLDSFSHITDDFYENSKMHSSSISIDSWLEQTARDDVRRLNFLKNKVKNQNILDFGCGNGGSLLKAKEFAKNVIGIELENQFKPFLKEKI